MSSPLTYTPVAQIESIRDELRAGFASGKLKSLAYRKYQILQLAYAIKDNTARWEAALKHDLGRPALEAAFYEIGACLTEIMEAHDNVEKWTKTEKAPFHWMWFAMKPTTRKEAKGTVLIIAPFNYPLFCLMGPVAAAIAAGNTVLIKPSEQIEATAALTTELIHQYLDPDVVRVVNGGIPEMTKILELQFDHIMFTGSTHVGRIVATAAAKHLTPVTLELGGKSPVIVDPSCDLYISVRRILFGRFANAGQTCVAADYVLVPKEIVSQFADMVKKVYAEFYPPEAPVTAETFPHLVTPAAYKRVSSLLERTRGKVLVGGLSNADPSTKYIPPTVVVDVSPDDPLMGEEIFGPILPIVTIESLEDSIQFVKERPHPLALYVFSKNNAFKEKVLSNTQSGGVHINDVMIHVGAHGVPFGGTGPSGYGYNTGKAAFDSFCHLRACLESPSWLDKAMFARFPPYTDFNVNLIRRQFYRSLPKRPSGPPLASSSSGGKKKWLFLGVAIILAAALTNTGRVETLPVLTKLATIVKGLIGYGV